MRGRNALDKISCLLLFYVINTTTTTTTNFCIVSCVSIV